MSGFSSLALFHKTAYPDDTRTLEELEAHYRGLQNNSPLGKCIQECIAKDTADTAIDKARIMSKL